MQTSTDSYVKPIAQAGLISKGIVYCLLGTMAFMAAFNLNGQSTEKTDTGGVFSFVYEQTGGKIMLAVIALGLICYTIWRVIQCFKDTEEKGSDAKGLAVRGRYLFSGLVYATIAAVAVKMLLNGKKSSGGSDDKQGLAAEILSKPFGQWLLGIAALAFLANGIYQMYYGLSGKFKKHARNEQESDNKKAFMTAGKIGYVARGFVWLLISWMFIQATIDFNPEQAGDTSKAFGFLKEATYGVYLLAVSGLGLICYGVFNFVRARFDRF